MSNTSSLTKMASLHSLLLNVKRDIAGLMQEHHKIKEDLEETKLSNGSQGRVKNASLLKSRRQIVKTANKNVISKIAALLKQASTLEMQNDRALRLMFLDGAYAYKENPGEMERLLDLINDLTTIKKEINPEKEIDLGNVDEDGQRYDEKRVEYATIVNQLNARQNLGRYKKFTLGGKLIADLKEEKEDVDEAAIRAKLSATSSKLNDFLDEVLRSSNQVIDKIRNDLRVNSRSEYDNKVESESTRLEKELDLAKKKRSKLFEMIRNVKSSLSSNRGEDEGSEIGHEFALNLIKSRVQTTIGNEDGTGGIKEYFDIVQEGIEQLGDSISEEYLNENRKVLRKRISDVLDTIDPGIRPGKTLDKNDILNLKLIIFLDRSLKKININISTMAVALIDYISSTQEESLASIKYTPTGSFDNVNLSPRDLAAIKVKMQELAEIGRGEKLGVLKKDQKIFEAFKDLTGFSDEVLTKMRAEDSDVTPRYTKWVNSWLGRTNQGWYKAVMSSIDSYARNLKTSYFDREDVYQNLFYGVSKSQGEKLKTTGSSEDSAEYFIDPMFLAGLLTCSNPAKSRNIDISNKSHTLKGVLGVVGKEYLWTDKKGRLEFIESTNHSIITFIRNKTNKIAGTLVRKRTEATMYEITESGVLLTPNDYRMYVEGLLSREGVLTNATPRQRTALISAKRKDLQRLKKIKEIRVKLYEGSIDSPIVGSGGEVYDESGAGRVEDANVSLADMGGQKGSFEYQDTLTSATIFDKGGYSANQIYLDMLSGDRTRLVSLVDSYRDRVVDLLNRNPNIQESLVSALKAPGMDRLIPSYVLDSENLFTPQNLTFYRVPIRNRVNSYLIPKKKRELEINKLKTNVLLASETIFEGNDTHLKEALTQINPDALTFVGLINTLQNVGLVTKADGTQEEAGQLVELEKYLERLIRDVQGGLAEPKNKMDDAILQASSTKTRMDALSKLITELRDKTSPNELKAEKKDGKWSISQIKAIKDFFKNPVFAYSYEKLQGLTEEEIFTEINNMDIQDLQKELEGIKKKYNEEKTLADTAKNSYFSRLERMRGLELRTKEVNNLLDLSVQMGVKRSNVKEVIYSLLSPEELGKELAILAKNRENKIRTVEGYEARLEELEDIGGAEGAASLIEITNLRNAIEQEEKNILAIEERMRVVETDREVRAKDQETESPEVARQRALKRRRYDRLLEQENAEATLYEAKRLLIHYEEKLEENRGTEDEDFLADRVNRQLVLINNLEVKDTSKNLESIKSYVKKLNADAKAFDSTSDIPKAQDNYKLITDYLNLTAKRLMRLDTERSNINKMLDKMKTLKDLISKLGPKVGPNWGGGINGGQYVLVRNYLRANTSVLDNVKGDSEEEKKIINRYKLEDFEVEASKIEAETKGELGKTEADKRSEIISQYRDMRKNAQDSQEGRKPYMSYASPENIFSTIEKMLKTGKDDIKPALTKEYEAMISTEELIGNEKVKVYELIRTKMKELWNKIRVYAASLEKASIEQKIDEISERIELLTQEDAPTHELNRVLLGLTNYLNEFVKDNGIQEGDSLNADLRQEFNFQLITFIEQYIAYMTGLAPVMLNKVDKNSRQKYSDHRKVIKTNPNLVTLFEGRVNTLRERHISVLYGDKKEELISEGIELDSDILKLHSVSNVFNDYDGAVNMNASIMATSEIIRSDMRHILTSDTVSVAGTDDVLSRKLWDFYFDLIKVSGDEALAVKDIDEKIKEIDSRIVVNREEMFKIYKAIKSDIASLKDPSLNVIIDTIKYLENQTITEPAPEFNLDQNQKKSLINKLIQLKKTDDALLEEKNTELQMKVSLNGLRRIQNLWRISQVHGAHFQQKLKGTVDGLENMTLVLEKENQDYYKNLLAILEGDVDPWNEKFLEVMLEKKKEDMRQDLNDSIEDNTDSSIGSQFVNKRIATVVCEALRVFAKKAVVKTQKGDEILAPWVESIRRDPKKAKSIGLTLYGITMKAKAIRDYVVKNARSGDKATRSALNEFIELPTPKSLLGGFANESKMTQREKLDTAKSRELNKEELNQLKNYLEYLRPKEGLSLPKVIQKIMGERAKSLFNPDRASSSVYNNLPSLPIQFGFINEALSESSDVLMRVSRKSKAKKQGEKGKSRSKHRLTQLNALKGSFIGSSFGNSIAVAKSTEQLFDMNKFVSSIKSRIGGIGEISALQRKDKEAIAYFAKQDEYTPSAFEVDIETAIDLYRTAGGLPSKNLSEVIPRILNMLGVSEKDLNTGTDAERTRKANLKLKILKSLSTAGRNSCGRRPGDIEGNENTDTFLRANLGLNNRDENGMLHGYIYSLYSKSPMNKSLSPEIRKVLSQLDCFFIKEKNKRKVKPVCIFNINKIPKNLKLVCTVRKDLLTLVEKYESSISDLKGMIRESRIERDKTADPNGKRQIEKYIDTLARTRWNLVEDILDIKKLLDIQSVPDFCDAKIQELNSRFRLIGALNSQQFSTERADELIDIQKEISIYDRTKNGRMEEGKRVTGGVMQEIALRKRAYEKESASNPLAKVEYADLGSLVGEVNKRYTDVFKSYNLIDATIVEDFWDLVKEERKLKDIRIPIQITVSDLKIGDMIKEMSSSVLLSGLFAGKIEGLKESMKEGEEIEPKIGKAANEYLTSVFNSAITSVFSSLNKEEYAVDKNTKTINRLVYIDETVTFYSVINPIISELNTLKNASDSLMGKLQELLFTGRDLPASDKTLEDILADRIKEPTELIPMGSKQIKDQTSLEKEAEYNETLINHLKDLIRTYGGDVMTALSDYARTIFFNTKTKITRLDKPVK